MVDSSVLDFIAENTRLIALFTPIILGVILKQSASTNVKVLANIIATAVIALVANINGADGVLSVDMFQDWGESLIISIAMYLGVFKELGVNNLTTGFIGPREIQEVVTPVYDDSVVAEESVSIVDEDAGEAISQ